MREREREREKGGERERDAYEAVYSLSRAGHRKTIRLDRLAASVNLIKL